MAVHDGGLIAVPDKTDAMFNDRNMCSGRTGNHGDVVFLHEILEWFKFWVHMEVCDGEACVVAQSKGLIKACTQGHDGPVGDASNGAKLDVLGDGQEECQALDAENVGK